MRNLLVAIGCILATAAVAQPPQAVGNFELYGDHIFFQLSVDGSEPLDFIFDTGDGLTVIDWDVAQSLDLVPDHEEVVTSAQGRISGKLIKHNRLEFGGITLASNIKVYTTDLEHLEISIGRNIDGIIGHDLLHHHNVYLNYDTKTLEVYGDEFPKRGQEVAFKLHASIPTIEAEVVLNNNETLKGDFFINTGAGTTLDFNTYFANTNDVINKTGDHYFYFVKDIGQEETKHYEGRISALTLGDFSFENLPIGISQTASGIQGDKKIAGIIGNRVLSRFNIMFDYDHGKMYLTENSRSENEFPINCSGIDVQLSEDLSAVLIHQVIEGSAAAKAGVRVDDALLMINGQSVDDMTLVDIKKILRKSGETVNLMIDQDGREKKVKLKLKALL